MLPKWAIALGLLALTFAVYHPVRSHEFVDYDDYVYYRDNPNLAEGFGFASIKRAFSEPYHANWTPLTSLSMQLDHDLYGDDATGTLLTNVVLHALSAVVLFFALARMTREVGPSAFVAACFAAHPLHVESVAWASERKDVLSGLFWMLTLLAYARYAERPDVRRYALVALALGLGLLAKQMLVTLPFVLLLLDWWPLRRLTDERGRLDAARTGRAVAEKLPLLGICAAAGVVVYLVQESAGGVRVSQIPLELRVMNALESWVYYVRDAVWPAGLAVFYPHPLDSLTVVRAATAAALIGAATAAAIVTARTRGYFLVGWFWYLGVLIPVIGIVQVGIQARADRFTYLPLVGLSIVFAWGARDLLSRRVGAPVLAGCGAAAVAAVAIAAFFQVHHWHDTVALFERAVAVTDGNFLAHRRLGATFRAAGDPERAEQHYRAALGSKPDWGRARIEYASLLADRGNLTQAVDEYRIGLHFEPDHALARKLRGFALLELGRTQEAWVELSQAAAAGVDPADVHAALGLAAERLGRPEDAISHYRAAIDASPASASAANNLAWLLATHPRAEIRDPAEAVRIAESLAERETEDPGILDTLGASYAAAGRFDAAVLTQERAAQIAARDDEARARELRRKLRLYEAGQPYVQGQPLPE